jgi:hypothetical protein
MNDNTSSVCFLVISCKAYEERARTFLEVPDTFIVTGDPQLPSLYQISGQHIKLRVPDGYLALPQKVMMAFEVFLKEKDLFGKYSHVYKIDDDCRIKGNISAELYDLMQTSPYLGSLIFHVYDPQYGDRRYHLKKRLSEKGYWAKKVYDGIYVPWLRGSNYVLARGLVTKINQIWHSGNLDLLGKTEVFEDLAVGKVCFLLNVKPRIIPLHLRVVFDEFD